MKNMIAFNNKEKKEVSTTQNIKKYIKDRLSQNQSIASIKKDLLQKGYDKKTINTLLITSISNNQNNTYKKILQKYENYIKYGGITCISLLILLFTIMLIVSLTKTENISIIFHIKEDALFSDDVLTLEIQTLNVKKEIPFLITVEIENENIQQTKDVLIDDNSLSEIILPLSYELEEGVHRLNIFITYKDNTLQESLPIYINDKQKNSQDIISSDEYIDDPIIREIEEEYDQNDNYWENESDNENDSWINKSFKNNDFLENESDNENDSSSKNNSYEIEPQNDDFLLISYTNAINSNEIANCVELQNTTYKDKCIKKIAKNKEEMNLCEDIEDINIKEACLVQFAATHPEICDELTILKYKNTCTLVALN